MRIRSPRAAAVDDTTSSGAVERAACGIVGVGTAAAAPALRS
jgi:hypothetical protein